MNRKQFAAISFTLPAALLMASLLALAACAGGGGGTSMTPPAQFIGNWETSVEVSPGVAVTLTISDQYGYVLSATMAGTSVFDASGTAEVTNLETGTIIIFKDIASATVGTGSITGGKLVLTITDTTLGAGAAAAYSPLTFTKKKPVPPPQMATPAPWETNQDVYALELNESGPSTTPYEGDGGTVAAVSYAGLAYIAGTVANGKLNITRPQTPDGSHYDNLFATVPDDVIVSRDNIRVFTPAYYLISNPQAQSLDEAVPLSYGKMAFNLANGGATGTITVEQLGYMYVSGDGVVIYGEDVDIPEIEEGIPSTGSFDMDLASGWNQVYSKIVITMSVGEQGPAIQSAAITYTTTIPSTAGFYWLLGNMLPMFGEEPEEGEAGE